jgi:hypothetical protein
MASEETILPRAWRWLGLSASMVLLVIVSIIGLISSGVFDPKPQGELTGTFPLNAMTVSSRTKTILWLEQPPLSGSSTQRMTAAWQEGELDIGYGLVLGDEEDFIVIAVSPLGYVTISNGSWENGQPELSNPIVPWRTWPHVRLEQESNEIWVDVQERKITSVRINRELLWQGEVAAKGQQVGLWTQSFSGSTEIDFQLLESFAEEIE